MGQIVSAAHPSLLPPRRVCPSMLRMLLALGALVFAGCVAPAATPDAASETMPPATALLTFTDCHEQHLNFPARAEDFADALPPGFSFVTNDPAGETVSFLIVSHRCSTEQGEEVTEAWFELPVTPAEGLAIDGRPSTLAIAGFASDATTVERYLEWELGVGFEPAVATLHAQDSAAALSTHADFEAESGDYSWKSALRPSEGKFGGLQKARFFGDGAGVLGVMLVDNTESNQRGLGAVDFTYSGSGAAPPKAQGVAHEVVGFTVIHQWEAIE